VTDGTHRDSKPSFDPDGAYLYFLSARELDPVYDNLYFGLSFPHGMRPWLAVLAADGAHPFRPQPAPPQKPSGPRAPKKTPTTHVDPEGLTRRLARFPLNESIYTDVQGLPGGWVLFSRRRAKGALGRRWFDAGPPPADDTLLAWSFGLQEAKLFHQRVTGFRVAARGETLIVRRGDQLRVLPTDPDKAKKSSLVENSSSRKSGWLRLDRIRMTIDPRAEWRQIGREAWRQMRAHFWQADLGGLDWPDVWSRYAPMLERVRTRGELDDVLWLLQGELGTSHAYALGGDRPQRRRRKVGRLGARLDWSESAGAWRITDIYAGDPGAPKASSPLTAVGVNVQVGDYVLTIDGVTLSADSPPASALVDRAGQPTWITVRRGSAPAREVAIVPLTNDRPAIYREWVLRNRARTHAETDGECGYIHIPDMGPSGFAAFHRDFKVESRRDSLVVDVRFNGGGHVSQLLLDKLSRRRLGMKVPRWGKPSPYPAYTRMGPAVCLTDAYAGSDGDIFSHAWRALSLGPLIGTRTWGGVVGISPRMRQVDRGLVTQPEFASWWPELAFGMENHGVEPDEEVPMPPEVWGRGQDPQLARAISVVKERWSNTPERMEP
jgi:tricorn protease